jgi:N-acetylmuramoyl-L-alanine amidase
MRIKTNNKFKYNSSIIFFISLILVLFSHTTQAQNSKNTPEYTYTVIEPLRRIKSITLDAGHGGKDGGCHGQFSNEKDITLAVALKVEKLLNAYFKDLRVVQTRRDDIFWELEERGAIANNAKSDLYLSIHVNSSPKRNGTTIGTETYVLGLTRTDDKGNAISENSEGVSQDNDLMNANDPMTQIKIAQYAQAFLNQSISLGSKIENEFLIQGRVSHGVKQKSLGVLAHSGMPGVLVEIGFLNNAEEEIFLNSEEGQAQVAMAIFNGIKAYKLEYEKIASK